MHNVIYSCFQSSTKGPVKNFICLVFSESTSPISWSKFCRLRYYSPECTLEGGKVLSNIHTSVTSRFTYLLLICFLIFSSYSHSKQPFCDRVLPALKSRAKVRLRSFFALHLAFPSLLEWSACTARFSVARSGLSSISTHVPVRWSWPSYGPSTTL